MQTNHDKAFLDAVLANPEMLKQLPKEELLELQPLLDQYVNVMAQDSLGEYGRLVHKWEYRYKHILKMVSILEAMERGEREKVIFVMPPRHGKTNWATIAYSGWYLGRHPLNRVLHVSLTGQQARLNSIAVRDTIRKSSIYSAIFPSTKLATDKPTTDIGWFLSGVDHGRKDPTFSAYGAGAGILGRGAEHINVDDPCDENNTRTPYQRAKLWDWFAAKVISRLENGTFCITMHRWHEEDLVGKIITNEGLVEDGGLWTMVHMEALNEDTNEVLWPEFQDLDTILQAKKRNPLMFGALWQGRPQSLSGNVIDLEWINPLPPDFIPTRATIGIDLAISKKQRADYTAMALLVQDEHNRYAVLDMFRGKWEIKEQIQNVSIFYREAQRRMRQYGVSVEAVAIEKVQYQQVFSTLMRDLKVPMVNIPTAKDKIARARAGWLIPATQGDFFMDENLDMKPDFDNEAINFGTRSTKDDIIDSITLAYEAMEEYAAPLAFLA